MSVISLSWPSFYVLRTFFSLFDATIVSRLMSWLYCLVSSLAFFLMVMHISAYSILCLLSPFPAKSTWNSWKRNKSYVKYVRYYIIRQKLLHYQARVVYYIIKQKCLPYQVASLLHYHAMLLHYHTVITLSSVFITLSGSITLTGDYYIIGCNNVSCQSPFLIIPNDFVCYEH